MKESEMSEKRDRGCGRLLLVFLQGKDLVKHMLFRRIYRWFVKTSPARLLVAGFAGVIFLGGLLLWLPISLHPGVHISFIDALFEAVSCICVTGLTVVGPGETFNVFGKTVMAILIQIGGMGVVLLGISFILLAGGRLGFKTRTLFVQAQNLFGYSRIVSLARGIFSIIACFEIGGALLCWPIFAQDYPIWEALGISCFHSISAFNNAGFDILGGTNSLLAYADNVPLNLITTTLVIVGGFGFIAILDLLRCRFRWKKLLLTTKIAAVMTISLVAGGTILLKLTTSQTWLQAYFQSVIARTAGFATYPMVDFTQAGLIVFTALMFIGANPNSTGGGVKTTTVFAAGLKAVSSTMEHDEDSCFHRKIPNLIFTKAYVVIFFGLAVCILGVFLILGMQPDLQMNAVIVEVVSAFGTVGSSMSLTGTLASGPKIVLMICMFIGRLGPVTIANGLIFKQEKLAEYTEENILIG